MRTKKITLFYELTQKEIRPPAPEKLALKDAWLKEIQMSIPADWEPKIVKVEYQLYNPETSKLRKFFEGPVVEWYVIQATDMLEGRPARSLITQYREDLLMDALGYDIKLLGGQSERRRESTTNFTDTQQWNDMLALLKETHFDPQGYEMPDSDAFWKMAEAIGYDQAKEESIKNLQQRLTKKLST